MFIKLYWPIVMLICFEFSCVGKPFSPQQAIPTSRLKALKHLLAVPP